MTTELSIVWMKLALGGLGLALAIGPLRAVETNAPATSGTNVVAEAAVTAPSTNSAPASMTNAPAASTALDYGAFRQIADRNIFNANRSSRSARSGERRRQPQVDSFTVVGTMTYAKGDIAFFDGSSGIYRKAVKLGETIAGHKVTGITAEEVSLEAGDKKVTLKVGGQMRREDGGPWEMATAGVSHVAVSSPAAETASASESSDSGSGGEVSDALKRLLQKRQQEEKNENP